MRLFVRARSILLAAAALGAVALAGGTGVTAGERRPIQAAAAPADYALEGAELISVLVVDDQPTMRRIVVKFLERLGVTQCVEAKNGREALRKLREAPADIIITDWNMPGMSGLEFLKAVRADPSMAALPVVMVTTHAAEEDVVSALQAGVTNYVVKPFTADAFARRIKPVLDAVDPAA